MSTLMPRSSDDPNTPLYYAPRWLRDRPVDLDSLKKAMADQKPLPQHAADVPAAPPAAPAGQLPHENAELFEQAVRQALRDALEPELLPPPPPIERPKRKRGSTFGMLMRWSAVAVIAAAGAVFVFVPFTEETSSQPKQRVSLDVKNRTGSVNELLDLGVSVSSRAPGATVSVKGLPVGARLTAGRPAGNGEWQIPADQIGGVSVIPPTDYRGQTNVSVKLHAVDGTVMDTSSVRLAWMPPDAPTTNAAAYQPAKVSTVPVRMAPPPAPPAPVVAEPPRQAAEPPRPPAEPMRQAAEPPARAPVEPIRQTVEPARQTAEPMRQIAEPVRQTIEPMRQTAEPVRQQPGETVRQMDPREMAALLKRAEELVANGDILPARPLLTRLAEARNARAAFLLGTTFDPAALKRFGEYGAASDMVQARNWYQKAKEWGYAETEQPPQAPTPTQLETIATFGR